MVSAQMVAQSTVPRGRYPCHMSLDGSNLLGMFNRS